MAREQPEFFKPRRLGHVNLWAGELARSQRFYHEICGLTVEFTEPGLAASFLGTGHTPHDLGLIEKTDGLPRFGRDGSIVLPPGIGFAAGLNHLAWELENEADLVDAYYRLKDSGVALDMTADHQIAHSIYLRDPDGNAVEFYCDTVRNWRGVLHGEMDLITSAWDPTTAERFTEGRYDPCPDVREVAGAPVHPQRLTHVVLESADLDAMVSFYTTIGGLKIRERTAEGRVVLLGGSHPQYEFNLAICAADASKYSHAAFELKDDQALQRSQALLQGRGASIAAMVDTAWKRSFFLHDADGLASEYYVKRSGPRQIGAGADTALSSLI
jgi:catechol 2,3-dioxygenase